ncbi:hypothetical protein C8R44DRAFT_793037 [Mycena epipterygia]|nr:hypothetical protein C8R44DRAFT_793037 [Mycena epipterygia]
MHLGRRHVKCQILVFVVLGTPGSPNSIVPSEVGFKSDDFALEVVCGSRIRLHNNESSSSSSTRRRQSIIVLQVTMASCEALSFNVLFPRTVRCLYLHMSILLAAMFSPRLCMG